MSQRTEGGTGSSKEHMYIKIKNTSALPGRCCLKQVAQGLYLSGPGPFNYRKEGRMSLRHGPFFDICR